MHFSHQFFVCIYQKQISIQNYPAYTHLFDIIFYLSFCGICTSCTHATNTNMHFFMSFSISYCLVCSIPKCMQ